MLPKKKQSPGKSLDPPDETPAAVCKCASIVQRLDFLETKISGLEKLFQEVKAQMDAICAAVSDIPPMLAASAKPATENSQN